MNPFLLCFVLILVLGVAVDCREGLTWRERRGIVGEHNRLRQKAAKGKVKDKLGRKQPAALNMETMVRFSLFLAEHGVVGLTVS